MSRTDAAFHPEQVKCGVPLMKSMTIRVIWIHGYLLIVAFV